MQQCYFGGCLGVLYTDVCLFVCLFVRSVFKPASVGVFLSSEACIL